VAGKDSSERTRNEETTVDTSRTAPDNLESESARIIRKGWENWERRKKAAEEYIQEHTKDVPLDRLRVVKGRSK
jgi:hypothetical protein